MRKKVLLIATVQSHIGQFHKPLMRLLKEEGWEIHVAARNNLAEKNGLELEYPDKVFDIPFYRSPIDPRNIKAYFALKRLLRNTHYDVIHCNTPVGGALGRLAKSAPRMNWLLYYPIEKALSRCTDKLISITEEDYALASAKFHCPVFHQHGVGANSEKNKPISSDEMHKRREQAGLSGPVFVNVGELLPNKNQKTAIAVMKALVNEYPDSMLYIAGNGPEKKNLENLIASFGLTRNISLLGYTTHLDHYLQISDLMIACSYREGLPLNVMEAMLCGKPVVASHNRGHDELIQEGVNGFLVAPDDVQAYAERIRCILKGNTDYSQAALESVAPYTDQSVRIELKALYDI